MGTDLVIVVTSEVYHTENRTAIRQTWASVLNAHTSWPGYNGSFSNIKLYFLLAKGKEYFKPWKTEIQNESDKYKDIILFDFNEDYGNLTLKSLMGLKWVSEKCPRVLFYLKVDEDALVNLPGLSFFMNHHRHLNNTMLGCIYKNIMPKFGGKWEVPGYLYPFHEYPDYVVGTFYLITGDLVPRLVDLAEHFPPMAVEDVLITGTLRLALEADLKKYDCSSPYVHSLFTYEHCNGQCKAESQNDTSKYEFWEQLKEIS